MLPPDMVREAGTRARGCEGLAPDERDEGSTNDRGSV